MVIIVTDPGTNKRYKLKPLDNGLCFQLFVSQEQGTKSKRGKEIKHEWKFTEKYPSNLADGLRTIVEMIIKDPDNNSNVIEIEKLNTAARTIDKHLDEICDKLLASVLVEMTGD